MDFFLDIQGKKSILELSFCPDIEFKYPFSAPLDLRLSGHREPTYQLYF